MDPLRTSPARRMGWSAVALVVASLGVVACGSDSSDGAAEPTATTTTVIGFIGDEEADETTTSASSSTTTTEAIDGFRANIGDVFDVDGDGGRGVGLVMFLESGTIRRGDEFVTSAGTVGTVDRLEVYPEFVPVREASRDPAALFDPEIRIYLDDADVEAFAFKDTVSSAPA